jgi:ion channel
MESLREPTPREPNYLYLTISLLAAVVLITSTSPQSVVGILGVSSGVFALMMLSAYLLIGRKREMLVAVVLGASAFLPFAWINIHPDALSPPVRSTVYVVNLGVWLLFTVYTGLLAFRSIIAARHIRSNEIYGAIFLYLVIGILFAEVFQALLVWQPDALYFDPGRFPPLPESVNRPFTHGAGDIIYYSFVTLGTVGYGDVTPASPVARSLSLIEAVTGIMYVATMIARFVSIQTSGENRRAEPRSDVAD